MLNDFLFNINPFFRPVVTYTHPIPFYRIQLSQSYPSFENDKILYYGFSKWKATKTDKGEVKPFLFIIDFDNFELKEKQGSSL